MSSYYSSASYQSASSTVDGQTTSYSESTATDPSGTTVHRVSKEPGQAATQETYKYSTSGSGRVEGGNSQGRIEDVTDADRQYEENIEDEYAKREGGYPEPKPTWKGKGAKVNRTALGPAGIVHSMDKPPAHPIRRKLVKKSAEVQLRPVNKQDEALGIAEQTILQTGNPLDIKREISVLSDGAPPTRATPGPVPGYPVIREPVIQHIPQVAEKRNAVSVNQSCELSKDHPRRRHGLPTSDDEATIVAKTKVLTIDSNLKSNNASPINSTPPSPYGGLDDSDFEGGFMQSPSDAEHGDPAFAPNFVQSPTPTTPSLISHPTSFNSATSTSRSGTERSKFKSALEDVRHFAGGLIHHPVESTKHYSILRHSHGIVYYQGLTTSLAITIFADRLLPSDRRLWLQMKGWTGKMGMRAKALFRTTSSWIEVTPATKADPSQLPPADERAWQRDINKFLKKAPKPLRKHMVRETDVVRIPYGAEDGYFQIVLTDGESRYPLCRSPVFRVASTTMSFSSVKGASLSTLPIELGIKIMTKAATTAAGNAVAPFANTVRSQVQGYMPSFWMQEAGTLVYDSSGVQNKFDTVNARYDEAMERALDPINNPTDPYGQLARPTVIGDASGPQPPFPTRLNSKVVPGTGRSAAELGMPTANLAKSPDDFHMKLRGVYFGWACILADPKKLPNVDADWHQALINVDLCRFANPAIVPREVIKVYLVHDFAGAQFIDAKISVVVMGFLRPNPPVPYETEAYLFETYKDIAITQASLAREAWGPEAGLQRIKTNASARSFSDRYVDLRQSGQRQINKMPLHKMGVRTPGFDFKDRQLANTGGIWVPR